MPTGGLFNWVDSSRLTQTWTTAPAATWSTISSYAGTTSGYQLWEAPSTITWNAADINLSAFEDLYQVGGLNISYSVEDAREPTEEEFFDLLD